MSARTRDVLQAWRHRWLHASKPERKKMWADSYQRPEQFDQQPGTQAMHRKRREAAVVRPAPQRVEAER